MLTSIEQGFPLKNRRNIQVDLVEAAVLLALTDEPENPKLWLGVRSNNLPTHKGEVALLGGKRDPGDDSLMQTALREAQEEAGLNPQAVRVQGYSHTVVSRWGVVVTPVVGIVPSRLHLEPDGKEMTQMFQVPLSYFIDVTPKEDAINQWLLPRWEYEGHKIWGVTACIIAEFLNSVFNTRIPVKPKTNAETII